MQIFIIDTIPGSKPTIIPSPVAYQTLMEEKLLKLSSEKVQSIELLTHPVKSNGYFQNKNVNFRTRFLETALAISVNFHELLNNHGIKLKKNTPLERR